MKTVVDELKSTQTLRKACEFYMRTPKFASISGKSQIDYERNLSKACSTKVQSGRMLGNIKLKDISFKHVTLAYDFWLVNHGIRSANYMATCLSIVINTAFRHEAILSNPVSLIKRTKSKPRKVKWTTPQVKLFIDTAYSDWRWRSIGLIVHMAFHWAQRIGDMRTLEWSSLDLVNNTMALEQSKRGTDVFIPIQGGLIDVLRQQEKDFGFQPYVVPRVNPRAGSYSPYDDHEICGLVNEVKEVAGLPKNLTAMDLRRTAITQMVEKGLDAVGIMQVSGHANPQSIKPYLVNTLTGATTAQACREDELI
jgi:integrase|tara:strand:+ start:1204 stop:2130 length:927 start_codon:yes stop_codon:yes gene_type:complete